MMSVLFRTRPFIPTLICAASLAGCASTPRVEANKTVSTALPQPEETRSGHRFLQQSKSHGDFSAFHVISAGVDGFITRVEIVRNAERTLDLQYFIYRGDETGRMLTEELRRAADRGVRVRVLVDDGDTTAGDEQILQLDGYPNMQVRVFNPFDYRKHNRVLRSLDFLFHRSRLDYRMHNKLLVADNSIALIGGRNVGNQYFQLDPTSQFADDDVFAAGPIAQSLSQSFDEFWNSDMTVPASSLSKAASPSLPQAAATPLIAGSGLDYLSRIASGEPYASLVGERAPLVWASARMVYDSPDKKRVVKHEQTGRLMAQAVTGEMGTVQSELLMVSPYFVPSDGELALLKQLRERNAAVRVLSNSLESAPQLAAQSGYQKLRLSLLQEGVELYEVRALLDDTRGSGQTRRISRYGTYALHAKLYVFDRRRLFVGSWNYDQRSLRINTEIGLLIDSPELASQVALRFEAMVRPQEAYKVVLMQDGNGKPRLVWDTEIDHNKVELAREPSRGWWQRQRVRLLALLPLQPEL